MKTEFAIKEVKKELEKLSQKMNNKTTLFVVIGAVTLVLAIIFLIVKIKNKIELLAQEDEFYYDEDDFYEDYHALDYEEELE